MKAIKVFFQNAILMVTLLLLSACSAANNGVNLVGSTPGDNSIKSALSIPLDHEVDFIRWNLELANNDTFDLNIEYGESQPNTLGFKKGGFTQTIRGSYSIIKDHRSGFKEVYGLISNDLAETIFLAKLNENIYHFLTSDYQLMVGNGGWSYSLNRAEPIEAEGILIASQISDDEALELVFEGRTPCQEFKKEYPEMKASSECFKIKWKLVLHKDSITDKPSTCTIRNIVDNQPRDVSAKWEILKDAVAHPNATIYRIMVDNLAKPLLLMKGDGNVLFFLDGNKNPFVGNDDFSFTLNRREEP